MRNKWTDHSVNTGGVIGYGKKKVVPYLTPRTHTHTHTHTCKFQLV